MTELPVSSISCFGTVVMVGSEIHGLVSLGGSWGRITKPVAATGTRAADEVIRFRFDSTRFGVMNVIGFFGL